MHKLCGGIRGMVDACKGQGLLDEAFCCELEKSGGTWGTTEEHILLKSPYTLHARITL